MGGLVVGGYDDEDALEALCDGAEVCTYEFENVPAQTAAYLSERLEVYPPPRALEVAQDRLFERELFASVGIPPRPTKPSTPSTN